MAGGEATRKGDQLTIDPLTTKPGDVPELKAVFEKRFHYLDFSLESNEHYWFGPTFSAWRGFLAGIVYERGR
jgi:hypothetical protein